MKLMPILKILFILPLIHIFFGCTSYFKRKDCEALNWFDHGYQIAMSGKRLNSDNFLLECKKVDAEISESQLDLGFKAGMANYCKPEVVFATGKKGLFLNLEFCDPSMNKELQKKHTEGLNIFCDPKNALSFGASGGIYNQICPADKEGSFIIEYKKGRKKFLSQSILENENKINQLENDLHREQTLKNQMEIELRTAESIYLLKQRHYKNENPKETIPYSPEELRLNDLRNELNRINNRIDSISSQKNSLQSEIFSIKKELITLD